MGRFKGAENVADLSVAEILSKICLEEARQLKSSMLKLRGREPMVYSSWGFYLHSLETPIFGEMLIPGVDGAETHGFKASLDGMSPEIFIGPATTNYKNSMAVYADYTESLLKIEQVGIDGHGHETYSRPLGYFDTYRGLIYDAARTAGGNEMVDEEFAAELRVALEAGLLKLNKKPKQLEKMARLALTA